MKRLLRRLFTPTILAAASTAIVFAAAFTISWESLRVLAISAGIRELLAPLYPATIDSLMVTGTVAVTALRTAPVRVRLYAWTLIAAAIAVSVLGNAVHSQAHGGVLELPGSAAAAASAVPALSLAASLHLFVLVLRHGRPVEPARESANEAQPEAATDASRVSSESPAAPPQRHARMVAHAAPRKRLTRLLKQRPDIGAVEVSRRLGVSRSTATRWLSQARRPRVVATEDVVGDE